MLNKACSQFFIWDLIIMEVKLNTNLTITNKFILYKMLDLSSQLWNLES